MLLNVKEILSFPMRKWRGMLHRNLQGTTHTKVSHGRKFHSTTSVPVVNREQDRPTHPIHLNVALRITVTIGAAVFVGVGDTKNWRVHNRERMTTGIV